MSNTIIHNIINKCNSDMAKSLKDTTLLTVKDVTKRLNISRQTLYTIRLAGKINSRLIGKKLVMFTEEDIQSYLKSTSQLS